MEWPIRREIDDTIIETVGGEDGAHIIVTMGHPGAQQRFALTLTHASAFGQALRQVADDAIWTIEEAERDRQALREEMV